MKHELSPTYSHTSVTRRFCLFVMFALGLIVPAITCRAAITDGLVSYWSLDATNGATAPDLSFANAMSLIGDTTNVVGQFSNAMFFNGSTVAGVSSGLTNIHSYNNADTGLPIYDAGSYSISLWLKGPGQTNRYVFSESSTFHDNPTLLFRSGTANPLTNRLSILLRNRRGQSLIGNVTSASAVFDNNWHHIVWTDDRGNAKLYVDGNLDGSSSSNLYNYVWAYGDLNLNTTTIGTRVSSNNTATFATVQPLVSVNQTFIGQIDEVATWERALSLAEVNEVRTNGVYTQGVPLPPQALSLLKVPANFTNRQGEWRLLSVDAVGTRPFTYQWSKNGSPITDATNRYYRIINCQTNNTGDFYSCAITNPSGFAITTNATLTVLPDPASNATNGLVNYWPLDNFDMQINPRSPELHYGHDMVFRNLDTNAVDPQVVPGQFGNAVKFNANNTSNPLSTYAYRTNGTVIYSKTNYTVSLWVNGTNSSLFAQNDRRVFSEGSSTGNNPLFTLGTDNNPVGYPISQSAYPFVRTDAGANSPIVARLTTRPVFDGNWHHLVWTDANGQGKMYVDGNLDETDYTYVRPPNITLNLTMIGCTARAAQGVTPFQGLIDEVATWDRVLTWTEIQQIMTNGVPVPQGIVAPTMITQPLDQTNNVRVMDDVTFTVAANGTLPFDYQWRKGNTLISGVANPTALTDTLILTNVSLADSNTTYSVTISNASGSVTSSIARLYVSNYTPLTNGEVLKADVDLTGLPDTQAGFTQFTLANNPGFFANDLKVTMTGIGTPLTDRHRVSPPDARMVTNVPPFMTQAQIYNDFIFANSTVDGTGMNILFERLATNYHYGVTIWSFDPISTGLRFSDWTETASGTPAVITNTYFWDGAAVPTLDYQYTFGGVVASTDRGKVQLTGLKSAGTSFGVFVNAIRLVANPVNTRITSTEFLGSTIRLTVVSDYPGQPVSIHSSSTITGPWTDISGTGTIIDTRGPFAIWEFPVSGDQTFYRAISWPTW